MCSGRGSAITRGSSGTTIDIVVGLKVGEAGGLMGTAAGYGDVMSQV